MSAGWVKSLQCKSRAFDDVNPRSLFPSSSCRKSDCVKNNVKDSIVQTKTPISRSSKNQRNQKTTTTTTLVKRAGQAGIMGPVFHGLTELPEGHSSRNVVEIIFRTRWGPKPFPGRVEMVFKIRSSPRTVARFEDYREEVRRRADSSGRRHHGPGPDEGAVEARCVADGNEMMRFQSIGPTSGVIGGSLALMGQKGLLGRACSFDGGRAAHEIVEGGRGMRAMLVCRVIAGRVRKVVRAGSGFDGRAEFDSESGEDGELMVYDSRAVLPCFLVIYKL